jgi:hypothetical protein
MRDPQAVISQVRQGAVPAGWRVFTKKRGAIGAFFRGTSDDPDPVLIFTMDAAIEYVSEKKPLDAVYFADLASVVLRADASTPGSASPPLRVWLDLQYLDGRKVRWNSATFPNDLPVIQQFLEAHALSKAPAQR